MDNLQDLLDKRGFSEPPEIKLLKTYIKQHYNAEVGIKVDNNRISITANSSALASSLHTDIVKLQEVAKTDKKIQIFTG